MPQKSGSYRRAITDLPQGELKRQPKDTDRISFEAAAVVAAGVLLRFGAGTSTSTWDRATVQGHKPWYASMLWSNVAEELRIRSDE